MAPTENPLAIGVFRDPTLAEQKAHALRQAGFRDDEIRVWGQGASTVGHRQEVSDILFRAGAYTAQTQPVEVGEVFIRKEIVTEERTITVAVQREEVVIERRSLRAQGTAPGEPIGKLVELAAGETIRIPIREEQVVIEKLPIVTEELIVGKRKVQETRHFSETVRREVPHIERVGDVVVHGSDDEDGVL